MPTSAAQSASTSWSPTFTDRIDSREAWIGSAAAAWTSTSAPATSARASRGLRTLVIDLDTQGNSTQYLLGPLAAQADRSIADFFESTLSFSIQSPARVALDIPGARSGLDRNTVELNQGNLRSVHLVEAADRIRLGEMCTCMGYRHPAHLAKIAATVDAISGGRVEMGIGGGWYEHEWNAYGYGFPEIGDRLRMLDEALTVLRKENEELAARVASLEALLQRR